jgi:class 3 adenylate cyclase
LKENDTASFAESLDDITIVFASVSNSMNFDSSENIEGNINYLNDIVSVFDSWAEECNIEKIKTIGKIIDN